VADMNDRNFFLRPSHRHPKVPETATPQPAVKSPGERSDPQTSCPSRVLAQTVSDIGLLCQLEVGFADRAGPCLELGDDEVLTLTGCPSIFLGTVSLSNRRKGRK
jgi:hypothetical protein